MHGQLPLILRLVWFIFIGIPVGLTMSFAGWVLCATVIGLPLGIWVLHRLPLVMTLKLDGVHETATGEEIIVRGKVYRAHRPSPGVEQHNFFVRALWFFLVGLWATFIWLKVAYLLTVLIVPIPVAFWMYNRVPWLLTLEQS